MESQKPQKYRLRDSERLFIKNGQIELTSSVDEIRESQGKSVDALFREVFKC